MSNKEEAISCFVEFYSVSNNPADLTAWFEKYSVKGDSAKTLAEIKTLRRKFYSEIETDIQKDQICEKKMVDFHKEACDSLINLWKPLVPTMHKEVSPKDLYEKHYLLLLEKLPKIYAHKYGDT